MLVLTETDIRRLISTGDALAAASDALMRDSLDEFVIPSRLTVGPDELLVAMAAHCSLPGLVLKVLSTQVSAQTPGLSSISGSVVWFESEGGRAVAVMDGSAITSLRTGAASGVATQHLAHREARVLAMVGAGGQAADQVRSVCAVRPIAEVRIASLHSSSRNRLAAQLEPEFPLVKFIASDTARAAVRGADVICTATPSTEPLFDLDDLGSEVHVNAVGSFRPEMCEIDPAILSAASVVAVDRPEAAAAGSGEIQRAMASSALDLMALGTLLAATDPERPKGITVFKSVGIAAQDWSLARLVVEQCEAEAENWSGHQELSHDHETG